MTILGSALRVVAGIYGLVKGALFGWKAYNAHQAADSPQAIQQQVLIHIAGYHVATVSKSTKNSVDCVTNASATALFLYSAYQTLSENNGPLSTLVIGSSMTYDGYQVYTAANQRSLR